MEARDGKGWARLYYSGLSRMHETSFSQMRPFSGSFGGTFSPFRYHGRSTRLSLTCLPASLSRAATWR